MSRNPNWDADRDREREFDKTSLRANAHGYWVHRDYAAHFFRWGWVSKRIIGNHTRVLDIGCGPDAPLAKVLNYKADGRPARYVGIDLNKLGKMPGYKWAKFIGEFDFSRRWKEILLHDEGTFDVITCFEVVEHMRLDAMRRLLRGACACLADGGKFIISTPVFNGRMAHNHINEMTVPVLQKELESAGFMVIKRYGTFMSDGDRKRVASPCENELVTRLKEYYSTDVLACFLAPLYPDAARNCLWVCEKDALA